MQSIKTWIVKINSNKRLIEKGRWVNLTFTFGIGQNDYLFEIIEARAESDPEFSWTAKLLSQGPDKCAEKFGEEAIESIIAATKKNKSELIHETADLLYHLIVMLHANGVTLTEITDELKRRKNISGIEEKKSRGT